LCVSFICVVSVFLYDVCFNVCLFAYLLKCFFYFVFIPFLYVTSIHSEVHTWICISNQVMFVIIQIHHHTIFTYNCLTKEKPSKDISLYCSSFWNFTFICVVSVFLYDVCFNVCLFAYLLKCFFYLLKSKSLKTLFLFCVDSA
jgi:hypothetical protein